MRFEYSGLEVHVEAKFDPRGRWGVSGVKPYFQECRAQVRVRTGEPQERLDRAASLTHKTCPVENLLRAAGVDLEVEFLRA